MQQHGLPVSEQMIFYGDFWVHSGERLGNAIADGGVAMPEAVACANAAMAEALIRTLQKRGIAVPEDVAVVGYDPFMTLCSTFLQSCMTNMNYNLGVNSVCQLHYEITGEICTPHSMPTGSAGACGKLRLYWRPEKWCVCRIQARSGRAAGVCFVCFSTAGMIQKKISAPDNLMEFAERTAPRAIPDSLHQGVLSPKWRRTGTA